MSKFEPTRWSLIAEVKTDDEGTRAQALEQLCQIYWQPLFNWLRHTGRTPDDAADLVQSFFVHIIDKEYLKQADPGKGKLRTWLLTLLRSHVNNQVKSDRAIKRGGEVNFVWIDAKEGEQNLADPEVDDPDAQFDRDWARTVYRVAMGRLKANYRKTAMHKQQFRVLIPYLAGNHSEPLDSAAEELDLSKGAVRVALHRMRSRFRKILRDEISATIHPHDDLEEEIRYLAKLLADD